MDRQNSEVNDTFEVFLVGQHIRMHLLSRKHHGTFTATDVDNMSICKRPEKKLLPRKELQQIAN